MASFSPDNILCISEGASVRMVGWDRIEASRRPLVASSHAVFLKSLATRRVSTTTKTNKTTTISSLGLAGSRDRRLDALESTSDAYRKTILDFVNSSSSSTWEKQLFWDVHACWHLCQILVVASPDALVPNCLDWIDVNFPNLDQVQEMAKKVLESVAVVSHPDFWPLLKTLALRGKFPDMVKILDATINSGNSNLEQIQRVLMKCPPVQRLSEAEYQARFSHFQSDLKILRDRLKQKQASPDELLLLDIMTGNKDAICTAATRWQDAAVAFLLSHGGTASLADLLDNYKHLCSDGASDQLQLALIRDDLFQVIRYAAEMDTWFVAHLADFLHICGHLQERPDWQPNNASDSMTLRDYTILSYASILLADANFFYFGVEYATSCSKIGFATLEQYIDRLPIQIQEEAEKLLAVCEKHNLKTAARLVAKRFGVQCFAKGDVATALNFLMVAEETALVGGYVDAFFKDVLRCRSEREKLLSDVVDAIRPIVETHDRFMFLDRVDAFWHCLREKQWMDAGGIFIEMLTTNLAPQRFWPALLLDALPLLELTTYLVFNETETYEIMRCIQDLSFDPLHMFRQKHPELKVADEDAIDEKKLDVIRLACLRNLSRAMLQNGCRVELPNPI